METQQLWHLMVAVGLIEAKARLEPPRNAQAFEMDSQSAAEPTGLGQFYGIPL